MHDDFIAFFHAFERVLASRGRGLSSMGDGSADEVEGFVGSFRGLYSHRFCSLVDGLNGSDHSRRDILRRKCAASEYRQSDS